MPKDVPADASRLFLDIRTARFTTYAGFCTANAPAGHCMPVWCEAAPGYARLQTTSMMSPNIESAPGSARMMATFVNRRQNTKTPPVFLTAAAMSPMRILEVAVRACPVIRAPRGLFYGVNMLKRSTLARGHALGADKRSSHLPNRCCSADHSTAGAPPSTAPSEMARAATRLIPEDAKVASYTSGLTVIAVITASSVSCDR